VLYKKRGVALHNCLQRLAVPVPIRERAPVLTRQGGVRQDGGRVTPQYRLRITFFEECAEAHASPSITLGSGLLAGWGLPMVPATGAVLVVGLVLLRQQ
jgi:hypothetical protein